MNRVATLRLAPAATPRLAPVATLRLALAATLRLALAAVLAAAAASCGPRVEYRVRPGFATKQEIPDEVVLDDGTVIRYLELNEFLAMKKAEQRGGRGAGTETTAEAAMGAESSSGFVPWEEFDDGTVRMKAERNDQIVVLTMRAFREERYAELWDQLVSPGVRRRAAQDGDTPLGPDKARERFIDWCVKWRTEVMTMLNRMSFAFSTNAVIFDRLGPGLVRMRLAPQITGDFKFRSIEAYCERTPEGDRVYLGGIR